MPLWFIAWLLLLSVNAAAFACFGLDKRRAQRGKWRLRESDLLLLALMGGSAGAYLGRWYFRHKTRKMSFSMALHCVAFFQVTFLVWFFARS